MRRQWLFVLGLWAISTAGCTMCANPHDCKYAAFGGLRERADRVNGRVGSVFDPAAEVNSARVETVADPEPVMAEPLTEPARDAPLEPAPIDIPAPPDELAAAATDVVFIGDARDEDLPTSPATGDIKSAFAIDVASFETPESGETDESPSDKVEDAGSPSDKVEDAGSPSDKVEDAGSPSDKVEDAGSPSDKVEDSPASGVDDSHANNNEEADVSDAATGSGEQGSVLVLIDKGDEAIPDK